MSMTIRRDNRVCATCNESTLANKEEAAAGRVRCTQFDKPEDWNTRGCVLWTPAAKMSLRTAWMQKIASTTKESHAEAKDAATPGQ